MSNPSVLSATIIYHFFYPDDVISARHFSDFAEELVNRDWKVTVLTSDRYCRYPGRKITIKEEDWRGVHIIRIVKPNWNQANRYWRLANSLWMMVGMILKLCRLPSTDVIVVGSDPQLSQFLFPILRLLNRQCILAYWCYDLYPEAIIADGSNGLVRWVAQRVTSLMGEVYRSLDLLVDIGPCMQRRLDVYRNKALRATLTPWALVEPKKLHDSDPVTRHELFGDTRLALLYSGNIGKAHDFDLFLKLARNVYKRDPQITFCFACRGNRVEELKEAVASDDYNIRLAPFVEESELEKRLNAADIHLVSLQPEWEGIVVPSKFFGSLAVGKPVIYAGPENSSIACWVKEFNVGLVLTQNNMQQVVETLIEIARNPDVMRTWQKNAIHAYHAYFSKRMVMDKWDLTLRELLNKH